jgi:hypothetical protein
MLYNLGLAYEDNEGNIKFNKSLSLLIIYDELVDDELFLIYLMLFNFPS